MLTRLHIHSPRQAESGKKFRAEDEAAKLKLEVGRIADLEHHLALERGERLRMEKEYLAMQTQVRGDDGIG